MNTTATKIANPSLGTAAIISENTINEAIIKVCVLRIWHAANIGRACMDRVTITAGLHLCSYTGV